MIRADRTSQSGKVRGGGVCVYINNRWCENVKVHNRVCTPEVEMLTLSLRPFYLPWQFPAVVVTCTYIPPSANIKAAAEILAEVAYPMLAK